MRTFIKILSISIFFGIWITMLCNHRWQHEYLGTVCSEITNETLNEGDFIKYKFKYKTEKGQVRDSYYISSNEPQTCHDFVTSPGSWVEKQLLENGKVYVPGWKLWYIFVFIIYSILAFVAFCAHIFEIICYFTDDPEEWNCRRCDCPAFCPFHQGALAADAEEYDENIRPKISHFFGYDNDGDEKP